MISVLGIGLLPITAANESLKVSGAIKAAFGLRADFFATFFAAFLGAAFFATFFEAAFFTGFFAIANLVLISAKYVEKSEFPEFSREK